MFGWSLPFPSQGPVPRAQKRELWLTAGPSCKHEVTIDQPGDLWNWLVRGGLESLPLSTCPDGMLLAEVLQHLDNACTFMYLANVSCVSSYVLGSLGLSTTELFIYKWSIQEPRNSTEHQGARFQLKLQLCYSLCGTPARVGQLRFLRLTALSSLLHAPSGPSSMSKQSGECHKECSLPPTPLQGLHSTSPSALSVISQPREILPSPSSRADELFAVLVLCVGTLHLQATGDYVWSVESCLFGLGQLTRSIVSQHPGSLPVGTSGLLP